MNMPLRQRIPLVCATTLVLTLGGCGFDPAAIRLPGTSVSGPAYPLRIQFGDVLNLPPGAKVLADGVEVGSLTAVHVTDTSVAEGKPARGYVTADIEVRQSVRLPADVRAELRQATPLGDVHIALTSPARSTASALRPGDVIPLAQTTRAPQVEDTMAGLATALGSGAVSDIQDTVRQINAVLPADPAETARVFGVIGQDLTDVAADQASLDRLLDGLTAVDAAAIDYLPALRAMLTDEGTEHLTASVQAVINVFYMFTNLGPVAHSALWLAPLVAGLDDAAKAYVPMLFGNRPLDLNAGSNLSRLIDLIRDKLIPFAEHGATVNLVRTTVAGPDPEVSATDRTDRIIDTLRMIGAVK
ncbi:MlaD family protein [Nocardia inohanensis]|uniref:MlaD family protein n=1 Tax=Nocardia inohanensis TaxID=209246 RepID=UPI0009FDC54C|nr:MlaD family protein [Nocardia inohanensis]